MLIYYAMYIKQQWNLCIKNDTSYIPYNYFDYKQDEKFKNDVHLVQTNDTLLLNNCHFA